MKLLYVTPERLAKSKRFMSKLEKSHGLGLLSRIAIDEVHCCSQWGHDFRPDYKFLGILRQQFPGVPLLGLTATASSEVIDDVKTVLNLSPSTLLFRAPFNRPNLFYEVINKPSNGNQCYDLMFRIINDRFRSQAGIVYCLSKKDAEEVTSQLQGRGILAGTYHADIPAAQRSSIHQNWINGKLQVVVATIAFGLGIDKPNVRFVIHHSLSKSCENYYQESGRCGRDGNTAHCILLFRLADVFRLSCMVFHERNTLPKLYAMLNYAFQTDICRRVLLAKSFGEKSPECDKGCDVCCGKLKKTSLVDCSEIASHLLPDLFPTGPNNSNRLTMLKASDKIAKMTIVKKTGSQSSFVSEQILAQMLLDGLIKEDFHFTPYSTISYLVPTATGAQLLKSKSIALKVALPSTLQLSADPKSSKDKTSKTKSSEITKDVGLPKAKQRKVQCDNPIELSDDGDEDLIFD